MVVDTSVVVDPQVLRAWRLAILATGQSSTPLPVAAPGEDLVRALAGDAAPVVRRYVAALPATPPDVLAALAADSDLLTRAQAASNPSTPQAALSSLLRDRYADVRRQLAANPQTPPADLDVLSRDVTESVRWWVASHASALPATLAALLADRSELSRTLAARNPSTPLGALVAAARADAALAPGLADRCTRQWGTGAGPWVCACLLRGPVPRDVDGALAEYAALAPAQAATLELLLARLPRDTAPADVLAAARDACPG